MSFPDTGLQNESKNLRAIRVSLSIVFSLGFWNFCLDALQCVLPDFVVN
ncbi:hypothetical protein HMPREF1554_01474 [Porphyromonas gingivalis F0569]|nr:hypothetical protein HMPREF1554_01474 [Porphyromonas gingivalis F0569]